MIQRIQSLYLLLAMILLLVATFEPVSYVVLDNKLMATLYNYSFRQNETSEFFPYILSAILLIAIVATMGYTIFMYKVRKKQMQLCNLSMMLLLFYYILMIATSQAKGFLADMTPSMFATFPLISGILCFMAKKRIYKDEQLVRAADRIR